MRVIYVTSSLPHGKKKEEKHLPDARVFPPWGVSLTSRGGTEAAMRKGAPVL
jgi:hypothetical protein